MEGAREPMPEEVTPVHGPRCTNPGSRIPDPSREAGVRQLRASKERPTLWVMLPHLLLAAVSVHADVPGVADLPITPPAAPLSTRDWLVEPPARGARITRSEDGAQLVLDNGLIRRMIRVASYGATVGLDDLTTGA